MKQKKVLLHSNIAWTISNFRLELIKFLVKSGYEVVCVADYDNFNSNSVDEITSSGASFYRLKLDRKGINPIRDYFYAFRLLKLLKQETPDIIINYTIKPVIYGGIVSKILGLNSIAVITGLGYVFIKKGILYKIVKYLYKFSLVSYKKIFFLNEEDFKELNNLKIISQRKSLILPGEGINTDFFCPKGKSSISENVVFIKICRLLWDKGLREYFKAAEIIKKKRRKIDFQLLGFIDENNPNAISKDEINELEANGIINYLGVTNDVRKYIADADCIVLASFYREGLPRTLLEAASMAKPIITTDTIGCKDTVDNEITGFLCKPQNVDDLVDKMEKIIEMSEEERNKMGRQGRVKIINKFDQEIINEIYLNVIRQILA